MEKPNSDYSRREFIKKASIGAGVIGLTAMGIDAKSYGRIIGANDRVQVGIVGFSNRFKDSLVPSFLNHAKELNFEFVAVSDIWNRRRDEAEAYIKQKSDNTIKKYRNNDELYADKGIDAVIISTADFQHALMAAEAVRNGKDVYVEKPMAETLEDAKILLKAVKETGKILQVGSQRRSAPNYIAADEYIKSGKFGDIIMVEMTWNVNQPGRWRLPKLVKEIRQEDTDWDRFLMDRPKVAWDPRKYLEFRLFWPYSSGIWGQWMAHQIDTVHWFSGLNHPRSVVANGGIYTWKDGRENPDTVTAVMDYGPENDKSKGFQVLYSSRFTNSAGGIKELYYSNAGMLNLDTNQVSAEGGLNERSAAEMGVKANLLTPFTLDNAAKTETSANTGGDPMTSLHMRNWMDCVRNRKTPNASVEAGYNHSIANIMARTAMETGKRVTFDDAKQEVLTS
ncbi:oxidoreductase [Sphingobacterium mizutaii NBRC 14946 = DSM 11724]|uniref:Inositol 2-dehydrogenase n=2 Tax=Sphingobacterium mizutaii TaxID=1010 RepID=A0AAJ4XGX0_9SPHI|nr:Gfo/Idh/MocA family oxidoreductase [Sphingobacterium mizutaii]GEM66531.1 oxidoreductase [Sphingobacterium mizutaii NBRC 14946 = DSM 11724]SDL52013.1 Predicted dehydrogenase [Sphingobacterium mizutaii]SNV62259.1 Inositol 2-dehydrogenase [Sphingobacterium mizutaii]